MVWALMRKDLHLLRPVVIAALLLAVAMYGILFPIWAASGRIGLEQRLPRTLIWLVYLRPTADAALGLSLLAAAACGGGIAPMERRERWAELVAMLPAPRWQAVVSRLVVGAGILAAIWLVHTAIGEAARWTARALCDRWSIVYADFFWPELRASATAHLLPYELTNNLWTTAAMFGIAWLAGALMRSPSIVVAGALGAVVLMTIGFQLSATWADDYFNVARTPTFRTYWFYGYEILLKSLTVLTLAAGSIVAVRRVAP